MPHHEDLAVLVAKLFESIEEAAFELAANRRRSGSQPGILELIDQLKRRLIAVGSGQRLFAIDAAARGDAVAAVGVNDPVAGHLPEPERKRQQWVLEVLF